MILKTITVECFDGNLTPTNTVQYLKKAIRDNQRGSSKNFLRLLSTDDENEIINFSFGIESSGYSSKKSGEEWLNFLKSPPPPCMKYVQKIHFECDVALEKSNNQPFFKNFKFFVEGLLLFEIKSHPQDKQRLFFRIYTHPMTPDEIKKTFIYDSYDCFEDQGDETYVYEGYDADLKEDWSDSFDDYESDRFLDDGMDDEDRYAPPQDDEEEDEMDRLISSYACQTDFELVLPTHLPQSGISPKNLLEQMQIVNDPFKVIPTHSDFFEFILQIYLISIETLRKEFSRSDFEAHLSSIITLVHKKKACPL